MIVILNTGLIFGDVLYYGFMLFGGPVFFWYLLVFRKRQKDLHDAYWNSGVETIGIVTQVHVTVVRGSMTGIEQRREYKLRYAYKAPGMPETVYIKDWVSVSRNQVNRRLLSVMVLPGQPESGVPKVLLERYSNNPLCVGGMTVVCLIIFAYTAWIFANISALFITNHCLEYRSKTRYCATQVLDFVVALAILLVLGLLGAWLGHRISRDRVPGRLWRRHDRRRPVTTATHIGPAPPSSPQPNTQLLTEREIPMAEAWAVLEDDNSEILQLNNANAAVDGGGGGDLQLVESAPVAMPIAAATAPPEQQQQENLPQAAAVELV